MKNGKGIRYNARELRRKMTVAENRLWDRLRRKQLGGFKFYRQHPIINGVTVRGHALLYYADFYCSAAKLVVELDGSSHIGREEYDHIRDMRLLERGIVTLRFLNSATDPNNIDDTLACILSAVRDRLTPPLPPSTSRGGRQTL
jgi:very-short-patch-repair endonuclease